MTDLLKDLLEKKLIENFKRAKKNIYNNKKKPNNSPIIFIPVTTTFPWLKKWGPSNNQQRYPYIDILFKDFGLYSDYDREVRSELSGHFMDGESRRNMILVRDINLNKYVFAYLGIHDPYYTRSTKGDNPFFTHPAFGVFINPKIESYPYCNASRRDVTSPECDQKNIINEFLLPKDARILASYQISYDSRHNGDFWHYWGSNIFWFQNEYSSKHWEWIFEFHFLEKVMIDSFDALLWPFEYKHKDPNSIINSLSDGEAAIFQKNNPNCHVIPYQWSNTYPQETFIKASEATAKFYLKRAEYPETAREALDWVNL